MRSSRGSPLAQHNQSRVFFSNFGDFSFKKTVMVVEAEDGGAHTRFVILNEYRDSR